MNNERLNFNADFVVNEGGNGQSFTAQSNGLYALEISNGNCMMNSDCFDITSEGIIAIKDSNTISIYPNPTSDHLTIEIKNPEGNFINLSDFAKGIYHLQILNEDQVLLYSESIIIR